LGFVQVGKHEEPWMEFRQLRYFIAVAEELHFGRAAKRLQISRPPLSQQILALERELGVELLIRGRSIELTEAGRVLLEHGRSASEAVTYAVQAAREAGEGMTRLRVGYPAGAASASVPLAVRIFRERFPSVALDTVVLFPRALDPPLHDHLVHDVLAGCGVAPSVVLEATTLESSLVAVAGGLGIAFAAESAAGQFTVRGVEFRPLVTVAPPLQFGVSWRRDTISRAVRQFLAVVFELAWVTRPATRNDAAMSGSLPHVGVG
jgi:DNA-binding transcriptional LysR family regulator